MSRMRIESQPPIEAFVGESGEICIKQESPVGEDKIIRIPRKHLAKVVNWLNILNQEQTEAIEDEEAVEDNVY